MLLQQMASLARHIAFQGLMQGTGSDISLCAFGKTYHLHRLILAQSPFFDSMINGPWKESGQTLIELTLDDPNITLEGFEIAIGRMYGIWTIEEDDPAYEPHQQQPVTVVFAGSQAVYASRLTPDNALSVLATATYLGFDSLCAQCTAYIVRTLAVQRVVAYVRFSHNHSYHPWSSQIADACHTFLCRNGFDDPRIECFEVFESLPAKWLPHVIGSDAFWVPSEWDRYLFCRRIVDRRRRRRRRMHKKKSFRHKGGGDKRGKSRWEQEQDLLDKQNRACDEGYDDDPEGDEEEEEEDEDEETIYEKLFSTSIVYMHMTLEQLQLILNDHDPWTERPFTVSHLVHESFWRQTEFRTLIEGADRKNPELGLTTVVSRLALATASFGSGYIRDDPIPVKDKTAVASAILPFDDPKGLPGEHGTNVPSQLYSTCSPFRFSVQFEDVSQLEVGFPLSSNSFYYAGSHWNVYVKKLPYRETGTQLGIHLHRLSAATPLPSTSRLRRPVFAPSHYGRGTSSSRPRMPSPPSIPSMGLHLSGESDDDSDRAEVSEVDELCDLADTIPIAESFSCFPDRRGSTRTWFRVYAASVGPLHQVTHFEAAPEDFPMSHSWGWTSPKLYTTCYLPELLIQPPSGDLEACRGSFCDQKTRTRTRGQGQTGHQSAVYDMQNNEETCDCEAQAKYGPHHHHHDHPAQLKLSFVMGHI